MDMGWAIEAAKQAPALGLLAWLVVLFLKHIKEMQGSHDERIIAICKANEERLATSTAREADALKTVANVVATNNEVLGSIKTLLILVEKDLKSERQNDRNREGQHHSNRKRPEGSDSQ